MNCIMIIIEQNFIKRKLIQKREKTHINQLQKQKQKVQITNE